MIDESNERRILISMPYGAKTGALDTGPMSIDFDRVLAEILRPAAPAGWSVFRFDEIARPGEVAAQFIQLLTRVELAIFDVTFGNANVYYELGVRQPNAPAQRTVLIAQKGTRPAFNVGHYHIWFYDFADPSSWPGFTSSLRSVLDTVVRDLAPSQLSREQADGLDQDEMFQQLERATNRSQLVALWNDWKGRELSSVSALQSLSAKLLEVGNLAAAVEVAERAYRLKPDRHEVVRWYGWCLRKSGDLERAEAFLRKAILLNHGDTEALGMLGGVYKRRSRWQDALDAYAKAAAIDGEDVYILLNLGALEAISNPNDNTAGRLRYQKVIELISTRPPNKRDEWDLLSLGEAHLLVDGVSDNAAQYYKLAVAKDKRTPLESAAEQLELFRRFGVVQAGATEILDGILRPSLGGGSVASAPKNRSMAPSPQATTGVAILHVSDLHFGSRPGADGKPRSMHRFGDGIHNRPLHVDMASEIERLIKEGRRPQDVFLIASGDIGYQADPDEYAAARVMFDEVRAKTGLPQSNLVVVPGNHDVSWVEAKRNRGERRFNEYIFFLRKTLGKERFRETHPHVVFDAEEQKWPDPPTILGFYEFSAENLFFVGLNSCLFETDEKHFGLVGREQLELLRQRLERVPPECTRIAVMHHHVIPIDLQFEEAAGDVRFDLSIVRDFGIVETLLQRLGFDLVLHGHKHMPALRESALRTGRDPKQGLKRLFVCGAGSMSVAADELPPGVGNHFSVLRMLSRTRVIGQPFIRVEWRGLAYDATATWQTLESWDLLG
jgi:tetratricopeptide (TPR) repeat protein/3',5'-cyclic AMP phosphodiesterase CpdA